MTFGVILALKWASSDEEKSRNAPKIWSVVRNVNENHTKCHKMGTFETDVYDF